MKPRNLLLNLFASTALLLSQNANAQQKSESVNKYDFVSVKMPDQDSMLNVSKQLPKHDYVVAPDMLFGHRQDRVFRLGSEKDFGSGDNAVHYQSYLNLESADLTLTPSEVTGSDVKFRGDWNEVDFGSSIDPATGDTTTSMRVSGKDSEEIQVTDAALNVQDVTAAVKKGGAAALAEIVSAAKQQALKKRTMAPASKM